MMGKDICKELRIIRQNIAKANDIEYVPATCNHIGDCSGTCPQCENELRYIERQLRRRSAMGKAAIVAGIALGVGSLAPITANAQSNSMYETIEREDIKPIDFAPADSAAVIVSGVVISDYDKEPIIGATISIDGSNMKTYTDFDGRYAVRVPRDCKLTFTSIGYHDLSIKIKESSNNQNVVLKFDKSQALTGEVVITRSNYNHPVDDDIYEPR
jgi:hypothetical protein